MHTRPMHFTGRPLAGFITVSRNGLSGRALAQWVEREVAWAESLPPKTSKRRGPPSAAAAVARRR